MASKETISEQAKGFIASTSAKQEVQASLEKFVPPSGGGTSYYIPRPDRLVVANLLRLVARCCKDPERKGNMNAVATELEKTTSALPHVPVNISKEASEFVNQYGIPLLDAVHDLGSKKTISDLGDALGKLSLDEKTVLELTPSLQQLLFERIVYLTSRKGSSESDFGDEFHKVLSDSGCVSWSPLFEQGKFEIHVKTSEEIFLSALRDRWTSKALSDVVGIDDLIPLFLVRGNATLVIHSGDCGVVHGGSRLDPSWVSKFANFGLSPTIPLHISPQGTLGAFIHLYRPTSNDLHDSGKIDEDKIKNELKDKKLAELELLCITAAHVPFNYIDNLTPSDHLAHFNEKCSFAVYNEWHDVALLPLELPGQQKHDNFGGVPMPRFYQTSED